MDPEDELRDLEARRLASLVAGDMATAEALHADDYELIPPSGRTLTKRAYLDPIASGTFKYQVFEAASPVRIRVRGDTAILRYQARIDVGLEPSQGDVDTYWHTDYWERRDGRWQAVWSQATSINRPAPS